MTHISEAPLLRLDQFGTVIVTGVDAKSFLQGQLSFDLDQLTPARAELACCNSAQGRVQAVTWLIERGDAIALLLPANMVDSTLARLRKYVLRAKVKLEAGAERYAVFAVEGATLDAPERTHREIDDRSFVQWPGQPHRLLCITSVSAGTLASPAQALSWHRADIEAGLPQVYPQTHETFVAQMLNLDSLGGISFEKGCYTGQEIIARTHFRGAVKRRMFRFHAACPPPDPGERIVLGEQHAGDVVDAVGTLDGCELLAVVTLAHANEALRLQASAAALERLPLPYQV